MSLELPALDPMLASVAVGVAVLLVVAGGLLAILGPLLGRDVSSAWRSYKGWLVMIPLVLGALWLGREATIVGIGLLSIAGFKEFSRALGFYDDWWFTGTVYLGIVSLTATTLVLDPREGTWGWYGLFSILPVYVIGWLLSIPVLRNRAKGQIQPVALSIVGFVYLGWMFGHVGFLANSQGFYGYVLFLLLAVQLTDVSAFVAGKAFGRRRLRSEISPNKTLEGSLGALLVALALPWILRPLLPELGPLQLVLAGVIVGVGGQLGDLTISYFKRDIGVKDMGAAIPGHGGVLDRIDSLIFVAPLFFHMVRWFHGFQPVSPG